MGSKSPEDYEREYDPHCDFGPREQPVLNATGALAWAMWQDGVKRQICRGAEDVEWREVIVDSRTGRTERKQVPVVEYVLAIDKAETFLRAWQVPVDRWARLIDLWELLVTARYRDWDEENVGLLMASLVDLRR